MNCECPQELRSLQLFDLLEGRNIVYMEIKGLEVGEGSQVGREFYESIVRKVDPHEILPLGEKRLDACSEALN